MPSAAPTVFPFLGEGPWHQRRQTIGSRIRNPRWKIAPIERSGFFTATASIDVDLKDEGAI
jgi:hypothetical protein